MTRLLAALMVAWSGAAIGQAPAGTIEVDADGCKLYLPQAEARGASRIRWSGECSDGLAEGRGVVRIYSGGRIGLAAERTFSRGAAAAPGESYALRGGQVVRSRGGDSVPVAPSELPGWALELSMLVEDRPARPAPPPAPVVKPKAPEVDLRKEAEAKAAAEKREAEMAAQEAERRRLQAEKEQAEARAAAERAAAAEKLEKERAAAEAKAAADRAAAAERAAREAEAKAALEKAEAEKAAKAAAEKARIPSVAGRGFAEGGAGAPLRAVVTFKLTTAEGRDLGIATFVAGKGEDEIRQNAAELASVYEKVSPFKGKLAEPPQVGPLCGGPGYVVEARITYPSAKGYGWFAGCMGEGLDQAAGRMRELEEQLHRDFRVSATSFWAYQYLIVGYVDESGFRGRAEYAALAQPGMMAPGRVLVLPSPRHWAECSTLVNSDPKLKDKAACLREALGKLKLALGAR